MARGGSTLGFQYPVPHTVVQDSKKWIGVRVTVRVAVWYQEWAKRGKGSCANRRFPNKFRCAIVLMCILILLKRFVYLLCFVLFLLTIFTFLAYKERRKEKEKDLKEERKIARKAKDGECRYR